MALRSFLRTPRARPCFNIPRRSFINQPNLDALPTTAATLWHNSACSKSRAAHDLLVEQGVAFAVREILEEPPTPVELESLAKKLGRPPIEWVRTGEPVWDLPAESSDADVLALVAARPVLLQRPIFELGNAAVVGRPPDAVLTLVHAEARRMLSPGPLRKLPIIFTAIALGAYVAYFYAFEQQTEQQSPVLQSIAQPTSTSAALPPGVVKRLPDGRMLMDDGSIQGRPH
jgi:arsenate reductase